MSTDLPEKPRAGKYCPRCHAMAGRDQAVCGQCGHRFRTGTAGPVAKTQSAEPDPLHRTMQFTLPLPAPRPAAPPAIAPPVSAAAASRRSVFAAVLAALPLCIGGALLWHIRHGTARQAATPVGVWETTLHGKASSDAHLEFAFQSEGTGRFSWRESEPAALSGQTPLHWEQNSRGRLILRLDTPAGGDPVSQTLAGLFSSHPWTWRVDQNPRRLVLGTLVFTEKL